MRKRRHTTHLVIHCAATPNGSSRYGVDDIRRWHKQERRWSDIGYHGVIHTDGSYHKGRHIDAIGAHCRGLNVRSVGLCLLGNDAYTPAQWEQLEGVVHDWNCLFPGLIVIGHNERSSKTCPGFDVRAWLAGGMVPLAGHVC